jgi:hypothetical protein
MIAGMSTISVPMFHAEFRSMKIELFVFGEIVCRAEFDSQSEVVIVNDFRGIGMSPSESLRRPMHPWSNLPERNGIALIPQLSNAIGSGLSFPSAQKR